MLRKGFTIIELLVIIVVISILAGMSLVTYGTWRERTAKTEVWSDLKNVALTMNNYRNFNNTYPTTLAVAGFMNSKNVEITTAIINQGSYVGQYCVQARSTERTSVIYKIDSVMNKTPVVGNC